MVIYMIINNELTCPHCSGELKYYDTVPRIVRIKKGTVRWTRVKRYTCPVCGSVHRILPDFLLPRKHYEAEIIKGVINGSITPFDLDYEDYPCEMTMARWKAEKILV